MSHLSANSHGITARLRLVFCAAVWFLASNVWGSDFGATVEKTGLLTRDVYSLGGTVVMNAKIQGDATAVGVWVDVGDEIGADLLAIGANVHINAIVKDDVRAAGGAVILANEVGDDAVIAGRQVSIDRSAVIHGRGLFAADSIDIDGKIDGNLHVAARTVRVRGEIVGNSSITAERIEIAPGALLRGGLVYTSADDIEIAPDAQILGTVSRTGEAAPRWRLPDLPWQIFFGMSTYFAAAILVLLLPRFTGRASQIVRTAPFRSLGVGALVFFFVPLLAAALALSAIGVWLSAMFFSAWLLGIISGYLISILGIADYVLREARGGSSPSLALRLGAAAIVIVVVTLLSWMPFVYVLLTLCFILFGQGAVWRIALDRTTPEIVKPASGSTNSI